MNQSCFLFVVIFDRRLEPATNKPFLVGYAFGSGVDPINENPLRFLVTEDAPVKMKSVSVCWFDPRIVLQVDDGILDGRSFFANALVFFLPTDSTEQQRDRGDGAE
jgi:hypothetical protein